jgi:septal ring factor EnvC (AmiA/AmiB activator)
VRERLEQRLKELTAEFEAGQQMLAELEARQAALRDTLLRLDGAITVLREELEAADQAREDPSPGPEGALAATPPA